MAESTRTILILRSQLPYAHDLGHILNHALAKNPQDRYASVRDFASDLMRLEGEVAGGKCSAPPLSEVRNDDRWSAAVITQITTSSHILPIHPNETISMIYGNIRARRGAHTTRFMKYNARAFRLIRAGTIAAGCYAFLDFNSSTSLLLCVPLYAIGLSIPIAVAMSIGLGILASWEKFAEIPRCHTCKSWMKHLSRIDRFSYTDISRAHAASDCLAALKQNLWEDAAKLFSIHGQLFSPKTRVDSPLVRYYLDFYICWWCGDESAVLTSEDGMGRVLKPREEYVAAYKIKNGVAARVPVKRSLQIVEATKRAATLAMESIDQISVISVLISTLFLGLYYYSQVPRLLRALGHKTLVTINSDPQGQSILVDGSPVVAPRTFSWRFESEHTIAGLSDRRISGSLYRFQGVAWIANPYYRGGVACDSSNVSPPTKCTVWIFPQIEESKRPIVRNYAVIFSKAEIQKLQLPNSRRADQQ